MFEYVTRSLETYIEEFRNNKKYIPLEKIKSISKQLLKGLDYCHERHIVHRDLKPENVLFTEDERVKICDFGSSKVIDGSTTSTPYIVSRYYRAPELILGKKDYNEKIDIFAAGCIIGELFTLLPLFPGKTEGLQLFEYMCLLGHPGDKYFSQFSLCPSNREYFKNIPNLARVDLKDVLNGAKFYQEEDIKLAVDLILKMIDWFPEKRLSAKELLKHKFFKSS